MTQIKVVKPVIIHLDEDGFMRYSGEWDENVMRELATYHGIVNLRQEHVDFIFQLREMIQDYDREDLLDEYCRRFEKEMLAVLTVFLGVDFDKVCAIAGARNLKDIKKQRLAVEKEREKAESKERLMQAKKDRIGVDIDEDGFLLNFDDWSEGVARRLAREEEQRIEGDLGDDHWKMIYFVRKYFLENGVAPIIRKLCKGTGFTLKYTYELFPEGPAKGLCKIAGLLQPSKCV